MSLSNSFFKEIGVQEEIGVRVTSVIDDLLEKGGNRPIDIQLVSEKSGIPGSTVKQIFFAYLTLQMLKGTFLPIHRKCGEPVGTQETSVAAILEKAKKGRFGDLCFKCHDPIEGQKDVEIQIIFWKPGTNV